MQFNWDALSNQMSEIFQFQPCSDNKRWQMFIPNAYLYEHIHLNTRELFDKNAIPYCIPHGINVVPISANL